MNQAALCTAACTEERKEAQGGIVNDEEAAVAPVVAVEPSSTKKANPKRAGPKKQRVPTSRGNSNERMSKPVSQI